MNNNKDVDVYWRMYEDRMNGKYDRVEGYWYSFLQRQGDKNKRLKHFKRNGLRGKKLK